MTLLYHFPLCPFSRRIRLAMSEYGISFEMKNQPPWAQHKKFLVLNPSGATPVMQLEEEIICGIYALSEFIEELPGKGNAAPLMPDDAAGRAEIRRLLAWFDDKFNAEVTSLLVYQKVIRRHMEPGDGGGPPDTAAVRAAVHNIKVHLDYIGYLVDRRRWLGGEAFSHADLAAAAHLSCVDYLGDVPWSHNGSAKDWYARVKSRPSFRALLGDRIAGMPPPDSYADLDF